MGEIYIGFSCLFKFLERLLGILVHICENLASRNFEGILPFLRSFVRIKSATFLREPALGGSRVEASKERIAEQQEYHNDRDSQIIFKSSTRSSKQTEDHFSKEIPVRHFCLSEIGTFGWTQPKTPMSGNSSCILRDRCPVSRVHLTLT